MQNALFRVRDVDRKPPQDVTFLDFVVHGTQLGKAASTNADLLIRCGKGVFCASIEGSRDAESQALAFSSAVGSTFDDRTAAVATVTGHS
jgi:hypothetical protein